MASLRGLLPMALLLAGCASKPGGDYTMPELPSRPAPGSLQSDKHMHQCLVEAERQWAARQRTLERAPVERTAFASQGADSDEGSVRATNAKHLDLEEGDIDATQRIREALLADASLSFAAKNVKILTMSGRVTLSGALQNPRERERVQAIAAEVVGPDNVVSRF